MSHIVSLIQFRRPPVLRINVISVWLFPEATSIFIFFGYPNPSVPTNIFSGLLLGISYLINRFVFRHLAILLYYAQRHVRGPISLMDVGSRTVGQTRLEVHYLLPFILLLNCFTVL